MLSGDRDWNPKMRGRFFGRLSKRRTFLLVIAIVALFTVIAIFTSLGWSFVLSSYSFTSAYDYAKKSRDSSHWFRSIDQPEVRSLAERLLVIARNLQVTGDSRGSPHPKDIMELRAIAAQIYAPVQSSCLRSESSSSVVCPEEYLGSRMAANAWRVTNCTTSKPVPTLVTVVVNAQELGSKSLALQLIRDIESAYPGLPIIVIGNELNVSMGDATFLPSETSSGASWNEAFALVTTPYVLVARDMFSFSEERLILERLIRVLSETPSVAAVGGGVRNATGHWKVGCFQSRLLNYVLSYEMGYYYSHLECMFCDYVDGPFLTRTIVLRAAPLDPRLEPDVLFQDYFLALSKHYLMMACPDAMFHANARMADGGQTFLREMWLSFARKWELNRVLIDQHRWYVLHKFTCAEVGFTCDRLMHSTASYAMPVCCQEQVASAYHFWATFCQNNSIGYYFDSGTCLGSVKMADVIPWDIDGDGSFAEANYSFIKDSLPMFSSAALRLDLAHTSSGNSYFNLWTPDVFVELYGEKPLLCNQYREDSRTNEPCNPPTKMEIGGFWVNGPTNPGLYARMRYGPECLRHALSWRHTGQKDSFITYEAGVVFSPCLNPLHHSCLDRFPSDGNIQFRVPEY